MRNSMLADREEKQDKWSRVTMREHMEKERKGEVSTLSTRMRGNSRPHPHPQPQQPSLISAPPNPRCWGLYGGTAERDNHRRKVTSDCKSSSSWREQTKRWTKRRAKSGSNIRHSVRAWGTRRVWAPAAGPLKSKCNWVTNANWRHITERSYLASLCSMSITVWPVWYKTAVWQTLC